MSALPERPRLARKARLSFDRHRSQHVLLYPEKGLVLSASSAKIVELCTGEHRIGDIVDALCASHPDATRERIEEDVITFLGGLLARGLLGEAP